MRRLLPPCHSQSLETNPTHPPSRRTPLPHPLLTPAHSSPILMQSSCAVAPSHPCRLARALLPTPSSTLPPPLIRPAHPHCRYVLLLYATYFHSLCHRSPPPSPAPSTATPTPSPPPTTRASHASTSTSTPPSTPPLPQPARSGCRYVCISNAHRAVSDSRALLRLRAPGALSLTS